MYARLYLYIVRVSHTEDRVYTVGLDFVTRTSALDRL